MTVTWGPDRGVRRTTLALAAAGPALIAPGLIVGSWWLIGAGVWAVIVAIVIELVYRP
ncbi:hypothetical protein AB0M39_30585 [Streptomyces sp. NPDC051907]|uniref:hypothetical protein n=1 Tax=Streptomyces sp. NPDC051907 TaxID=3155284 RepID=UPI00343A5211